MEYELCGKSPLVANGTVSGRAFHFTAHADNWEFEVARQDGVFASKRGESPAFRRAGTTGDHHAIERAEAHRSIADCIAEFTRTSSRS
jgi:hypothetical protein